MSTKQEDIKHRLHKELQIRYREFFESQLAIHLLKHSEYFPAVKKISAAITEFMITNKSIVLNVIKDNPKIIMELREPYFGSCFEDGEIVSAETAYEKILATLNDEQADLDKIMEIHCMFIQRIYDCLEQKAEKADFVHTLFPSSLFNADSRSRIEKKGDIQATTQLGITKHPVFSKMLEKHPKKHLRALDKYEPNPSALFFKSATEKSVPTVCGPSGHTGSLMLGAKLYGKLNASELKEYALASFAFLTAGGNHSFHEVFIIANLLDMTGQAESYVSSIPESIISTDSCKPIQKHFPEFL